MKLSRRDVLASSALSAAHLAFARQPSGPSRAFPTDPRHRLAVATYPFRARIVSPTNSDRNTAVPGMDLPAFARYIRSEFNVFGIEPLDSHFASTDLADIRKLRSAFDAAGVRTVNIPVDADADLCSPDPAKLQASLATYQRWIDIAAILGSPSLRIGIVPHCAGPADIAGPVAALAPVLRYAADHNVVLCLENDDPELGTAARITAILQRANNPWLRALPDFANSLMGGDEAFNASAVRGMFRYAGGIAHVKDAELINKVHRTVSLQQIFSIVKEAGFRGYYSMESDSAVDPTPDTHHLIEQCLSFM